MNSLKNSLSTELKSIDKISFKKFFLFGGLIPALIAFPLFYLFNPVTQQNIINAPITVMSIMALTVMFLLLSLYALIGFKVFVVVTPRVSNGISTKTYLVLAKNKFIQNILDLFVDNV